MRLFVTGSGTEIGKTVVTSVLAYQLRQESDGLAVAKPVLSGFEPNDPELSDPEVLLRALGTPVTAEAVASISPWRYRAPLSPDMAAARENTVVPFGAVVKHCRQLPDPCLVEGVGGVMVPLDDTHTVLDWIQATGMPALLVGGSYLGTMSHTLCAAQVLAQRDIVLKGIVLSESAEQPVPLEETRATLARFLPSVPIVGLHRMADPLDFSSAPDLLEPLGLN